MLQVQKFRRKMGKKQHSKDRMYLTKTEWATEWGGAKSKELRTPFKRLPFYCCAYSLSSSLSFNSKFWKFYLCVCFLYICELKIDYITFMKFAASHLLHSRTQCALRMAAFSISCECLLLLLFQWFSNCLRGFGIHFIVEVYRRIPPCMNSWRSFKEP